MFKVRKYSKWRGITETCTVYQFVKSIKEKDEILILKPICWENNKGTHLLQLKRTYRSQMHRTEPSFFHNSLKEQGKTTDVITERSILVYQF